MFLIYTVLNAVTMGADFKVGLYKEIHSHVGEYGNVVKGPSNMVTES